MTIQQHRELLNTARFLMAAGHYHDALYFLRVVDISSTFVNPDEHARQESGQLSSLIKSIMAPGTADNRGNLALLVSIEETPPTEVLAGINDKPINYDEVLKKRLPPELYRILSELCRTEID